MMLLFILVILYESLSISINRGYMGNALRNKALRLLIRELEYKRHKNQFVKVVKKSEELRNTYFLNYCVCLCEYESLPESDKIIIDTIVGFVLY